MSKSDSSPDDGQYVPSTVKIIELPKWSTVRAFSGQNDRAPQMIDGTGLLRSKSYSSAEYGEYVLLNSKSNSSTDDGQYVPSHVKII